MEQKKVFQKISIIRLSILFGDVFSYIELVAVEPEARFSAPLLVHCALSDAEHM